MTTIERVEVCTITGERLKFGSVLEPVTYNVNDDGSLVVKVRIIGERNEAIVFAKGGWVSIGVRTREPLAPITVSPAFEKTMPAMRKTISEFGSRNPDGSSSIPFTE